MSRVAANAAQVAILRPGYRAGQTLHLVCLGHSSRSQLQAAGAEPGAEGGLAGAPHGLRAHALHHQPARPALAPRQPCPCLHTGRNVLACLCCVQDSCNAEAHPQASIGLQYSVSLAHQTVG